MKNKDIPTFTREVLKSHGIGSVPCDLIKLASDEGIKVIKDSDVRELRPTERGRFMSCAGECFIIYDDMRPLNEKRFTVAHELGHYFLKHEQERERFERYLELKRIRHARHIEAQADLFAKHLLNPNFDKGDLNT